MTYPTARLFEVLGESTQSGEIRPCDRGERPATLFDMPIIFRNATEVRNAVGRDLGESGWHEISQDRVNKFADATGDHQWIHTDPERARSGPFGGTIAHGYLTLSLGPVLLDEIIQLENLAMGVNYGCNKVRFVHPVLVGSNLRLAARLVEAADMNAAIQATLDLTFQIEGVDKPACVAQGVVRWSFAA